MLPRGNRQAARRTPNGSVPSLGRAYSVPIVLGVSRCFLLLGFFQNRIGIDREQASQRDKERLQASLKGSSQLVAPGHLEPTPGRW